MMSRMIGGWRLTDADWLLVYLTEIKGLERENITIIRGGNLLEGVT